MGKVILSPKTFLTYSLGCRTNQAEIEDIGLKLSDNGLKQTTNNPDIVLLNTCVVTQKAEKETRQKIRELRKKYPDTFLVVLGCAVTAKEKLDISLPEANLLIPNEQKKRTVEIIEQKLYSSSVEKVIFDNKYILSGRKFIKIQDGCNGGCSFCLTQFIRGKPTNVPSEKIIKEINYWVEKRIKEVILAGINIGLYSDFTTLLKKIITETKIERISFSSIYPEMLTDEFLSTAVGNSRVTQCFHLSLQSGSQSVLKRMNRKTNLNDLLEKLQLIKSKNLLFTFRVDIIIGFPNETEKEFQETIDFIKKAGVSFAHIFPFSPRKGTVAYEMIKSKKWIEVSRDIKKERVEKIRKVVEEVRNNEAKYLIAKLLNCLIVRKITDGYEGITENGWPILVRIMNNELRIKGIKGKILPVKITGFEENYLFGEITSLPTNSRKTSGTSTLPSGF